MRAYTRDGWLIVAPYPEPEAAANWVATTLTSTQPGKDDWRPAYLGWDDGVRVAQVRSPAGQAGRTVTVWLRKGPGVIRVGRARL